MAIPNGSGTEILNNISGVVNNATATLFTVDTNHIITIISIIVWNSSSSSSTGGIELNNGSADVRISNQIIGGLETFVWNDKIVLHPTHVLKLYESSSLNNYYWVSYIDQNWED